MPGAKRRKLLLTDAHDSSSEVFGWKSCAISTDEDKRLRVKEDAVESANLYAEKLNELLGDALEGGVLRDDKNISLWMKSFESIQKDHKKFEKLVGVVGATGTGKSSLLNAILDMYEILPSGHEQAATAVPCKVSWNYDDRTEYAFIAEIYFQSSDEVIQDLANVLDAFRSRAKLLLRDDCEKPQQESELAQVNGEIVQTMVKVHAIWNLDEEYMEEAASKCENNDGCFKKACQMFRLNPAVSELLHSEMKSVNAPDADSFAESVKPYLDTTTAKHGEGDEFAAWPLVKEAKLFMKSNVLKGGISLVDLPGIGDTGESRVLVTQKYQEKLDVTMVVAPVQRAADEALAQSLIGKHQALQMQMNGCFNAKKFAVVLSKTDEIDQKCYIKAKARHQSSQGDNTVKHLQETLANAQSVEHELISNSRRLTKMLPKCQTLIEYFERKNATDIKVKQEFQRQIKLEPADENSMQDKRLLRQTRKARLSAVNNSMELKVKSTTLLRSMKSKSRLVKTELKATQRDILRASHALAHWAITTRNNHVRGRIESGIQRKQKIRGFSPNMQQPNPRAVEVLPTSSTAFWKLGDDEPLKGFPQKVFTDFPQLERWLRKATSESRERHLDDILGKYHVALIQMQTWVDIVRWPGLEVSPTELDAKLQATHTNFQKKLDVALSGLCNGMREHDPLFNDEELREAFVGRSGQIVKDWALKYPNAEYSTHLMAYQTFRAIIVRKGAPYRSTGADRIEYDWVPKLALPLLEILSQNYDGFSEKIEELGKPCMEVVKNNWAWYIGEIGAKAADLDMSAGNRIREAFPRLQAIYLSVQGQIIGLMRNFCEKTRRLHSAIVPEIRKWLKIIFEKAQSHNGKGSYRCTRDDLEREVSKKAQYIFVDIWNAMKKEFEEIFQETERGLLSVSAAFINQVKTQLALEFGDTCDDQSSLSFLRNESLGILSTWTSKWQFPDKQNNILHEQDASIPSEVTPGHMKDLATNGLLGSFDDIEGDDSCDEDPSSNCLGYAIDESVDELRHRMAELESNKR